MKRNFTAVICLIAASLLLLASCGSGKPSDTADTSSAAETTTAPADTSAPASDTTNDAVIDNNAELGFILEDVVTAVYDTEAPEIMQVTDEQTILSLYGIDTQLCDDLLIAALTNDAGSDCFIALKAKDGSFDTLKSALESFAAANTAAAADGTANSARAAAAKIYTNGSYIFYDCLAYIPKGTPDGELASVAASSLEAGYAVLCSEFEG